MPYFVSPWPSWPYLHQPKVYTTPSASVAMLWRQPQATETIFTSSVPSTCNTDLESQAMNMCWSVTPKRLQMEHRALLAHVSQALA